MTTPAYGPAMSAFRAAEPPGFASSPFMAPMNAMFGMLDKANAQQYGQQPQAQGASPALAGAQRFAGKTLLGQ